MLDRQELEKNIDLLSERANKAEQSYFELLERIKEEQKLSYNLREKVLARNTQIADLKHRLEKAESNAIDESDLTEHDNITLVD